MLGLKSVLKVVSGATVGLMLAGTTASAQSADASSCQGALDCLVISDTAQNAEGRIAVNAAAGDLNQQVNSAVIAAGGELTLVTNVVTQTLEGNLDCNQLEGACVARPETALITADAFSHAHGAIAVNGVAGPANQQANLIAIGIGTEGEVASLELLSQTRASQGPVGGRDESALASAVIDPTAFTEASGIVQVNLTAGEDNSSANVFALVVMGGAN